MHLTGQANKMDTIKVLNWIKGHRVFVCGIGIGIIAIAAFLLVFSQSPQVISATVSPEVIVKGQNQEVTMTVTVKPVVFVATKLKAVMAEQGYKGNPKTQQDWVKYFSVFQLNPKTLGDLANTGKDSQGNVVYKGTFTVNNSTAVTVQIQPTNMFGTNLLPNVSPQMARLAITTRPATIPPDSGEAGKQTLEGVDSDYDGLRDDVQREIMFLAPESEKLRMALGQYAKAEQALASQTSQSKEQSDELLAKESDGGACLYAVNPTTIPTLHVNYALATRLEDSVLNTSARKKLKVNNYKKTGIQFTGQDEINRCSFNPSDYSD